LSIVLKSATKIAASIKSDKNIGYFTRRPIYRSVLLRMRKVSNKNRRENQNTHLVFNNYMRTSCRLWDNVERYCTVAAGHRWK